eukprot:1519543-Pleurochrysis_carterae.AAC.1
MSCDFRERGLGRAQLQTLAVEWERASLLRRMTCQACIRSEAPLALVLTYKTGGKAAILGAKGCTSVRPKSRPGSDLDAS